MTTAEIIEQKINASLSPAHLDIANESHMHNVPAGSESHFRLVVVSDDFDSKGLVARHRTINKILADELAGSIHALALHTFTSKEWLARGETAAASPECRGGSKA